MKNFFYFLGALFVAVAAAFLVHGWLTQYNDPGYVLIGFGHWSMETSLVFFAVASIIVFFVMYVFFRFLGWTMRLPSRMKEKGKSIKFNRSQEALIAGLVDSAEGNWERAEKVLIKHAANSGAPILHYLTAARAAQSRGAITKRDEYLNKAKSQSADTDIAVGLTQAELHLSAKEFAQALDTLTKLHSIDPKHASVMRMLHQTYQLAGDWEGLRKLIPSLYKHKILMEAEVKLLETETHTRLLKQAAEEGDREDIQKVWAEVPEHVRSVPGVRTVYFAAMIESGAGTLIEEELVNTLLKNWDETLLVLYANIESGDTEKQLKTAEQWLAVHATDPVLLRTLGKISLRCKQMEKSEQYLSKSIAEDPTVAAYQLLGDLLLEKGDKDKASDCFRKGLELASQEVVHSVEAITG
jgi:HemY protein